MKQAVIDWLEVAKFDSLGDNERRKRQKYALLPIDAAAERPDAYRLHLLVLDTGLPLVAGGALDQPFVMRRELEAVRLGIAQFEVEDHNREARISDLENRPPGQVPVV